MKITSIILSCTLWCFLLTGQTIEPAGLISHANYYQNAEDISLHVSFGELATETLSTDDMHLSQGFLQAFFDLVPTNDLVFPDLTINIGPNPCTTHFTIKKNLDMTLDAYLFDLNGRLVSDLSLQNQQTIMRMENLPAGSYFLAVHYENQAVFETAKIIKL